MVTHPPEMFSFATPEDRPTSSIVLPYVAFIGSVNPFTLSFKVFFSNDHVQEFTFESGDVARKQHLDLVGALANYYLNKK